MNYSSCFGQTLLRARRFLLSFCVLLCGVLGLSAGEPAKRAFDIPAGPAETTLRRFSDQAGGQFLFSAEKVAGVRTNAVKGEFTAPDALQRLVAGTALRAVHDERTGALTVDRSAPTSTGVTGFGTIDGRVFNRDAGAYVNNARVVVDGMRTEAFTDETGHFTLTRVPAGAVVLRVFYTGFAPQAQTVTVAAGERVTADVFLSAGTTAKTDDGTIVLDAFKVATQRDMAASDIAVNEQRYAAEIKNVVSTDSFADIADGNVGEFAKYLPGVTLNRSGSDGLTLSIGGVPPGGTPIMMDGNGIANAAGSNANRQVEFENIAVGSLARVEVSRSQNPDTPANAIGGSVNLISRSAFERSRPLYTVKTHVSFRGPDFSLNKEPGPFQHKEYVFLPNLEFSAVVPVTRNFGFTASALATRTFNNGPGVVLDWVPTVVAQSANYPATTPDRPYLARYRLQERPKITERNTISLSADWRVNPNDVLTVGFQYTYFMAEFWVRQLNFDVGRVASFGDNFTQGANGAGFVQILTDAREKNNTAWAPSLRYKHNGPIWQWQVTGAYSAATNNYSNEGYFLGNNAFFRNVTVRFQDLTVDHPSVVSVKDAAGVNDVNPYDLSNYRIEGLSSQNFNSAAIVRTVGLFARREFQLGALPLTAKAGADLRSEHRDLRRPTFATTYLGPNGVAADADNTALPFYDPSYSSRDLKFGPRMQWFDLDKVGERFRTNREQFTDTETERVNAYRSSVTGSQAITETILAPYLRLDTTLLDGRLQFTGGVRYERTEDVGDGPLIDPSRIYRRNAAGEIERNANGTPVVIAPLATVAGSQLAYIDRGTSTDKSYDDFFPSVNGSFKIRPNLIARASFGRSFNRPDFGNILPTINLPDPESTARTITATNPALKPWYANSYGVSLEYYFNEPSTGVVSVRAYRRDITDFWGTSLTPASDDILDAYGVDPAVYGSALGYLISTTRNVGDARVTGTEFDFRQNLTFLPRWARGFTVFGNITLQQRNGTQQASLGGFVKKTYNWGVTFSRDRFSVRLAVNHRGEIEQGTVTTAGAEPGTTIYLQARAIADLSAEYRLTRRYGLFVTGRNVNSADEDTVRYGPSTPGDKIITNRINYGPTWYVGAKATF
jgi:TonB-dependent receptor